jgi:hypothetical protein
MFLESFELPIELVTLSSTYAGKCQVCITPITCPVGVSKPRISALEVL